MAELNWQAKIYRHRGSFIHKDELEEQSHVFRLLSGAEKFEDEHGWDGDSDPLALINPLYDAEIEAIRQQWDHKETEKKRQHNHIKDLTEKVAKRIAGKQWVANIKSPRPFPRLSSWSQQQQRFVVDMLARYSATGVPANPPAAEANDVRRLMDFISSMREEQEEYFKFAKELNATQLSRYNYINPYIEKYIHGSMQNKIRHMKREYPSHYQQVNMLPLAPPAGQPPNFYATSEPLELGEIPICVIPTMEKYTDLKRQTSFLVQFFPTEDLYPKQQDGGYKPRDGTYLYKMPVSADPNIALLSAQQEFDVVTSPSALKTLLDNCAPSWDRQWEVPVTVRLMPGAQAGTHKRVVFLDKPLPARSLNNMERTARAHKRTVRLLVCKRVTGPGPFDYSIWEDQPDRRKTKPFRETVVKKKHRQRKAKQAAQENVENQSTAATESRNLTEAEEAEHGEPDFGDEFETDAHPDTPDVSVPQLDTNGVAEDSDSDSMDLQIDCPDQKEDEQPGQESQEEARQEPEGGENAGGGEVKVGKACTAESEGPSVASEMMSSGSGSASGPGAERPTTDTAGAGRPPLPGGGDGVGGGVGGGGGSGCPEGGTQKGASEKAATGETKKTAAAAEEGGEGKPKQDGATYLRPPPGLNVHYRVWKLGGLRLLVRASTHAMRENPNAGLVRYTVHAKPAYQAALGIEVLTRTEVISQWLDCLLRPNSRIVRVHLDPVSQIVISPEERTLGQLTEELVKYDTGFKPQYGLQVLESLMRELTSLTPGQYLLSHDSRTGPFVRLSRSSEPSASGGVDLHKTFPLWPLKVALESPRCLSLDPSILTSFNTRYGRVPATFNYKEQLGEGGWKEHWSKMKEKGIKKKKRKKNTQTNQQKVD